MTFDNLVHENKEEFIEKVKEVSINLGINPNWLMLCMFIESGIDHTAVNPFSGAYGLIQFMPFTAINLGTTLDKMEDMTNVDQLDWVYKYLRPYRKRMKTFVDVYFAIFFPRAIGKPDNYVLSTDRISASKIAQQNSGYDLDHNGEITVAEVSKKILSKVPSGVTYSL